MGPGLPRRPNAKRTRSTLRGAGSRSGADFRLEPGDLPRSARQFLGRAGEAARAVRASPAMRRKTETRSTRDEEAAMRTNVRAEQAESGAKHAGTADSQTHTTPEASEVWCATRRLHLQARAWMTVIRRLCPSRIARCGVLATALTLLP